eukprot:5656251-Amphidinium_carterae.1
MTMIGWLGLLSGSLRRVLVSSVLCCSRMGTPLDHVAVSPTRLLELSAKLGRVRSGFLPTDLLGDQKVFEAKCYAV